MTQAQKKPVSTLMKIAIFVVSFQVIFLATWFFIKKTRPERFEQQASSSLTADSLAAMDSLAVTADSAAVQSDTSLTGEAVSPAEQDQIVKSLSEWEKMYLLDQLSRLRASVVEKDIQINELNKVVEERDALDQKVTHLSASNQEQQEKIQLLQETLPNTILQKLKQQQDAAIESIRAAEEERQKNEAEKTANGIRKLAKIYESMRPEDAAPILAKLDDQTIIQVLQSMRQRQAAKVLTNFDPELAARISAGIGQ